jgi:2-iminobutanoate/2-iminopropanoate deaminase
MIKYINEVKDAPQAIGPYSQATTAGGLTFISGQIPIDPQKGQMVEGGIEEQAEMVMKNLTAILRQQGLTFQHVMKATIFLTDLANFQKVNAIYAKHLGNHRPARATIQVSALPMNAQVEIEMIALSA